jgi:protein involved in ribonucleotide reduction
MGLKGWEKKYILAGLRMYGDMLAETLQDPALYKLEEEENRKGFEKDSEEVERLIRQFEAMVGPQ